MKLLIEIPEGVLKTRRYTDFFGCGSTMLTAMLDSGTPLDTVLDEIRAEIDMEKLEDSPNFCIKAHNVAVDRILQIIDKYKAERGARSDRST